MRIPALIICLLLASSVTAKPREWTPAYVVESFSDTSQRGNANFPGLGVYGVPIYVTLTWYRFQTTDTVYTVVWRNKKHPLNVTLHGHAKIYADGSNLHILDDGGKDVKAPITEKFAAPR